MRNLLASIWQTVDGDSWQEPGPERVRLEQLILELNEFDATSHRPKGVAMMQAMSGRAGAADAQLGKLRAERERADELMSELLVAFNTLKDGAQRAPSAFLSLLIRYREGLLLQMTEEETLLRAYSERLLTNEEWSRVVSDMSTRIRSARTPVERSSTERDDDDRWC